MSVVAFGSSITAGPSIRAPAASEGPDHARPHRLCRVSEDDIACAFRDRWLRLPALREPLLRKGIRLSGGHNEAHVHTFESLIRGGLAIALIMLGVEFLLQRRDVATEQRRVRDRDRD